MVYQLYLNKAVVGFLKMLALSLSLALKQQAVKGDVNLGVPAPLSSPRKDSRPENAAVQRQAKERNTESSLELLDPTFHKAISIP